MTVARRLRVNQRGALRALGARRRGAVLLEVIISMAVFVAAAAFVLRATGSVFDALDRSRRDQAAVDLAVSTMAELEAGIINLRSLRSGQTMGLRGPTHEEDRRNGDGPWRLEIETSRSEHPGLTLVELTVLEDFAPTDERRPTEYTIRRLLPVSDQPVEEYEEDELLDQQAGGDASDHPDFDEAFDGRFDPSFGEPSWQDEAP